jgi:outer membrane protein OmpA-like peptidoglycan-associated protein
MGAANMIKIVAIFICLCLFNIVAHAGPKSEASPGRKDVAGLGLGAVIGGLIAGPPGAIVGAAGGAWFTDRQNRKDEKLAGLETRLLEKQTELARLQGEFSDLEYRHGMELQKVRADQRATALEKLSNGVAFTVYFRTDSNGLDPEITHGITQLARYLQAFPEIQVRLEAHADERGTTAYNSQLSQRRADAVKQAFVAAGLPARRIRCKAFGETMATSASGDQEGYIYDRRVNIHLSLDRESYAAN